MKLTSGEVFKLELDLLGPIKKALVEGTELSEEEKIIYGAYSAIQKLRVLLDHKEMEGKTWDTDDVPTAGHI